MRHTEHWTAVSTLFGLISSDLHQQPQYAEAETLPLGHRFMPHIGDVELTSHGKLCDHLFQGKSGSDLLSLTTYTRSVHMNMSESLMIKITESYKLDHSDTITQINRDTAKFAQKVNMIE